MHLILRRDHGLTLVSIGWVLACRHHNVLDGWSSGWRNHDLWTHEHLFELFLTSSHLLKSTNVAVLKDSKDDEGPNEGSVKYNSDVIGGKVFSLFSID